MTETYLQKLQREHKERKARIAGAAKKVVLAVPEPEPAPIVAEEDDDFEVDPKSITFKDIFRKVCKYYKVTMLDIISARRGIKIVLARHVIAYIASEHTALSIPQIASRLGGRDRSTIVHSILRIKDLSSEEDRQIAKDIDAIKRSLNLC